MGAFVESRFIECVRRRNLFGQLSSGMGKWRGLDEGISRRRAGALSAGTEPRQTSK
jgi:hypothetical protein